MGNSSGIGTASHPEEHRELWINKKTLQRTRNKCIHYEFQTRFCKRLKVGCVGPSNKLCKYYREYPELQSAQLVPVDNVKPFNGIKLISMNDISVEKKFAEPTLKKVNKLIAYYEEHNELDKPIVVSCGKGHYILEDKYLRYYVAGKLKLEKIHAIMKVEENNTQVRLRRVGQKVKHKLYGIGVVNSFTVDYVEIYFSKVDKTILIGTTICLDEIITIL